MASERSTPTGLIVAPGFIDMMGQTATPMLRQTRPAPSTCSRKASPRSTPAKGVRAAPLGRGRGRSAGWRTMAEYFRAARAKGLPLNVAQTIGHTQVRRIVLGDVDRRPSDAELEQMRALVKEAMQAGAIGVSTALIYPPAVYATTEEIAALAEVAGQYGGRYYTHMRNEGDRLEEAIDEALEIGRRGKNARPHLSSEDRRPAELGQDAAGHRQDQSRPRRRPASHRRHLSLHQQRPRASRPSSIRGTLPTGTSG